MELSRFWSVYLTRDPDYHLDKKQLCSSYFLDKWIHSELLRFAKVIRRHLLSTILRWHKVVLPVGLSPGLCFARRNTTR